MTKDKIKKLKGPIIIFGAGGFIGFNMLQAISSVRSDVYGISRSIKGNWRFNSKIISKKNIIESDISDTKSITKLIKKIKPKTIINLAAYGAYARQKNTKSIYDTNFISTINLLEILKSYKFAAYIHAGSQSEYGTNSSAPKENSELYPNSHYSVSKVADYFALKYYGKIEDLPVVHLRLYSAYGPWEEPDRLMPVLLSSVLDGKFPKLVNPNISRDFIYVDDVIDAFLTTAIKIKKSIYGEAFNIATGKKTTIEQLALLVKKITQIKENPVFGGMKKRNWDLEEWYGNNGKVKKIIGWTPSTALPIGVEKTIKWQRDYNYKSLIKNYKPSI